MFKSANSNQRPNLLFNNQRFQNFSPMRKILFCFFLLCCFFACDTYRSLPDLSFKNNWKTLQIEATPQQKGGDSEAGWQYLISGNYIGSGIPFDLVKKKVATKKDTILKRSGDNAYLPYGLMAFSHANGTKVMTGNCLTCHGGFLNGEFIAGLGGIGTNNFSKNNAGTFKALNALVKLKYKRGSKEREAYEVFGKINKEALSYIVTPFEGVNPAFRLEEAYIIRRNKEDLTLQEDANYKLDKRYTLAADVPPWWHLKKKNALYYNGMGRGDFTKLLMQASIQGIKDSTEARAIQKNFVDVLAYLESLEAPKYPKSIDEKLAWQGEKLFNKNCAKCHGTYGEIEAYPNKLVALEVIKTDPYYARNFSTKMHLANWYNDSWYGKSVPQSFVQPMDAYIAPPLDGVWATAPYFHNASVPNLEGVLNSKVRPIYWQRIDELDYKKMGWKYLIKQKGKSKKVYDTTLPGYGNQGHYFGDKFTIEERYAVIEYLKTL